MAMDGTSKWHTENAILSFTFAPVRLIIFKSLFDMVFDPETILFRIKLMFHKTRFSIRLRMGVEWW